MEPRIGSLFSGYGGLDIAVAAHFQADLAWYAEVEPAACRVMEAHHPGVPNLGDVITVDWDSVPPVDILTGGYPCQPFSTAGARKGTNDERHLWPYVRDAISVLRPRIAVLENVRGHLTLGFDVVLADLADMGWSARWGVVRASDAGAPHRRERLFIVATRDSGYDAGGTELGEQQETSTGGIVRAVESVADSDCARSQGSNASTSIDEGRSKESNDVAAGYRAAAYTESESGRTRSHQAQTEWYERFSESQWGVYENAISRWEFTIGRSAPSPTIQRNDKNRLSPIFVEWMMGLPEGWVTGHGLSASQELKMLGNGVVPQQAELALQLLR